MANNHNGEYEHGDLNHDNNYNDPCGDIELQ